jgi:uncharacterized DUF497 family protein
MEIVMPSQKIADKLGRRGISLEDCGECFVNRTAGYLYDTRAQHQTDPATRWFIAETDKGRLLKIVFIFYPDACEFHIKSAYEPNQTEIELYISSA